MFASNNLRSPLGRARGLGSAKEGLHHWWAQRLTSLALIPLTVWFVAGLIHLATGGEPYEAFMGWIANPCNATLMILFLGVSFHHAQLGMQVVFEDYVSCHAWRTGIVIAVKFACYGLAALGIVSTLICCFGG
jgi:succinate dehydrogenase / fumarate reductase membrane anchor subunit